MSRSVQYVMMWKFCEQDLIASCGFSINNLKLSCNFRSHMDVRRWWGKNFRTRLSEKLLCVHTETYLQSSSCEPLLVRLLLSTILCMDLFIDFKFCLWNFSILFYAVTIKIVIIVTRPHFQLALVIVKEREFNFHMTKSSINHKISIHLRSSVTSHSNKMCALQKKKNFSSMSREKFSWNFLL